MAAPPVVSVTMQLKFQQSFVVSVDVPQLQFFDRVVATTVASQRQGSQCKLYRRSETSRCIFLDGRRHARWCANDRIWSDSAEKLWFRSCILLTSGRCPCCCSSSTRCGRPWDPAATVSRSWCLRFRFSSSPESADNPAATETDTLSAWVTAMKGLFAVFPHFSRSSGLSRS